MKRLLTAAAISSFPDKHLKKYIYWQWKQKGHEFASAKERSYGHGTLLCPVQLRKHTVKQRADFLISEYKPLPQGKRRENRGRNWLREVKATHKTTSLVVLTWLA